MPGLPSGDTDVSKETSRGDVSQAAFKSTLHRSIPEIVEIDKTERQNGNRKRKQDLPNHRENNVYNAFTKAELMDTVKQTPHTVPDVVALSDSEDEPMEVQPEDIHVPAIVDKQFLKVRTDKLLREEALLTLLLKIHHSQNQPKAVEPPVPAKPVTSEKPAIAAKVTNAPPPLKKTFTGNSIAPQQRVPVNLPAMSASSQSRLSKSPASAATPPPLVHVPHKKTPHQHAVPNGTVSSPSVSSQKPVVQNKTPSVPKLTSDQKRTLAKQVLRKQLEKNLQQIPTPRPQLSEMTFVPSLNYAEFVYLVGLEDAVNSLQSSGSSALAIMPFTCARCGTDFTPVWKRDKPGSENVVCETCVSSNRKQAYRKEYASRVKAEFTLIKQQEQELERRISSGSPVAELLTSLTPSAAKPTPSSTSSSTSLASQLTAANLQHHQAMLQVQAAEQMAMLSAQAMSLPYQMYGMNSKRASELQKQYLLDMISSGRMWNT